MASVQMVYFKTVLLLAWIPSKTQPITLIPYQNIRDIRRRFITRCCFMWMNAYGLIFKTWLFVARGSLQYLS